MMEQHDATGNSSESEDQELLDEYQQTAVMVDEDERFIDVQDVLSECPPDEDSKTSNPLRESYNFALQALPHQPYSLSELYMARSKLTHLIQLLQVISVDSSDHDGESLSGIVIDRSDDLVDWEMFDHITSSYTVRTKDSQITSAHC
jgi:hypothetical protein